MDVLLSNWYLWPWWAILDLQVTWTFVLKRPSWSGCFSPIMWLMWLAKLTSSSVEVQHRLQYFWYSLMSSKAINGCISWEFSSSVTFLNVKAVSPDLWTGTLLTGHDPIVLSLDCTYEIQSQDMSTGPCQHNGNLLIIYPLRFIWFWIHKVHGSKISRWPWRERFSLSSVSG